MEQSSPNRGGFVVANAVFRFSFRRSVSNIFAIKVESCQKSLQIFHVFALPNFVGAPLPKCPRYHPGLEPHPLVKFREVTPTTPIVIGVDMLNFKPEFKCLPLKFFGDPGTGLWCALASLGQCLACVKISGASAP